MRYIVAYTLKRNDIGDELDDFYLTFDDNHYPSGNALPAAEEYYRLVLSECPTEIEEGWHVFTASISTIIIETDF